MKFQYDAPASALPAARPGACCSAADAAIAGAIESAANIIDSAGGRLAGTDFLPGLRLND